jgi:hypothetical protein
VLEEFHSVVVAVGDAPLVGTQEVLDVHLHLFEDVPGLAYVAIRIRVPFTFALVQIYVRVFARAIAGCVKLLSHASIIWGY